MSEPLTGLAAMEALAEILDSAKDGQYPHMEGATGVFTGEDGVVTAFDNRSRDCWVEEFDDHHAAMNWLH